MNERNKLAMATMLDNLTASAVIAGVVLVFRENIEFPLKELALLFFAVVFLLTASFYLRGD
jgi:multisubunit Na+/H+ antiporter MnhG subunit